MGCSGAAEIAQLATAFSRMAHALAELADYIRTLAAAISHEFKTPLTALHGTVERLREHEATMSPADRSRFLGNLAPDTERLERLVRRLLELARADVAQHAGPGARVALRANNQDDAVVLAVEKSGQTLSRANLGRVFDPFFTTARDRGGTGLGLTIARALVVGHGGKIEVATTADTTTFTITLPAGRRE